MQMSAAPAKSKSFSSLSFSTWGPNTSSSGSSPFANGGAPPADPGAEKALPPTAAPHRGVGSRSSRQQRFSFTSLAPSPALKSETDGQKAVAPEDKPPEANAKKENEDEGEEEEVKRTWNLRPRKGYSGSKRSGVFSQETCRGGGGESQGAKQRAGGSEPKSNRLRGHSAESPVTGGGERKNEKTKLWIALSRDEIEEDIFIMTGNRPSRRPKKHPKIVQKQLDNVFPGLWLVGMTPDCYRITDAPVKR